MGTPVVCWAGVQMRKPGLHPLGSPSPPLDTVSSWLAGKSVEVELPWGLLRARPEVVGITGPHPTGQRAVTWPHLVAREAGKCSLPRRKRQQTG